MLRRVNIFLALSVWWALASLCAAENVPTTQAGAAKSQAATSRASTQPTLVSLHLDRVPATQAIVKLFDLAHLPTATILNPHFVDRMEGIDVTLDATDTPFAIAMLDVFRQCGIEPEQMQAPGSPVTYNL